MIFNVGVTGTGSLIGQGIIKSIQNSEYSKNYRLVGFDYFKDTVGSFWCENNYVLPDILKKEVTEQDWLDLLVKLIIKEKLDILFIGVDFELPILATEREAIKKLTGCHVIVSDKRVIDIGNDKYLTYKFLKENNLNYPETHLVDGLDFSSLKYPLIIKPRVGARSIGVYKVESEADLRDKIKKVDNPVIQELVGNDDTEYTCGVIFFGDELKAQIPLRRTLKAGNTAVSEYSSSFSEKINEYVAQIAVKLKPFGSCNLQLRVDNNGIPKLFEINPRHSGTTYMRSLFGHNEVIYTLKYLLEKEETSFTLKEGKALRYYEEKLV
ncbi:ATP-grasp domain-containing protein [Oceanihabitans sp. 2_MG-2023]|uniref:ATP-grasp domain-containing protein n=1 Tax=Oceanihabitans sp. 2_MG-2023 TaxID=3062661 RepID=UPI0026E37030|nr:ATP-grasp domain-containing protein [Oceanihabitans sp. 2_MG-2023]MDO6595879.1 ATP-grasp domain-containing protein [Oceanihabitans sp. 2_MG-2023]